MIPDIDGSGPQPILNTLESDKNQIDTCRYNKNTAKTKNCDENTCITEQFEISQTYKEIVLPQSQNDCGDSNVIDSKEDEDKSLNNPERLVENNINVKVWQVKIEKIAHHKCNCCPKAFLNVNDLTTHNKNHEKRFREHVLSSFVKMEQFNLSENKFVCNHNNCSQCCPSKQNLMLHQSAKHARQIKARLYEDYSNEKPYKCEECDLRFVAETTLRTHAFVHKSYQYICYCGIGFYRQKDLKAHKNLVQCTKPLAENIKPPHNIQKVEPPVTNVPVKVKVKTHKEKRIRGKLQRKADIMLRQKSGENNTKNKKKRCAVQPSLQAEIDSMRQRKKISRIDVEFRETINKRFECPKCKKDYRSRFNAEKHYRGVHRGERPYSCKVCGKSFTQDGILTVHLWRHLGVKNYPCHYCEKSFYDIGALKLHERTHSGYKPYKCGVCRKKFSDPSAFQRHTRIHTGDRRYKCPYCPNAYTDHSQLYMHRKRHENNRNFICNKCKKGFFNKSDRRRHISRVHNCVYNFTCKHCGKGFGSKSEMKIHVLKVAKRCDICDGEFFCQRSMQIHHQTHVKKVAAKFVCDHCGIEYSKRNNLVRHILRNHAPQKYVCDHCKERFSYKETLRDHIMYQHLDTLRCNICYKGFLSIIYLKKHKMIGCTVDK